MMRHHPLLILLLLALPASLAAQVAACPGGRQPAGDLGIRTLRCTGPGAACAIFVDDDSGQGRHVFSVEPVIARVEPDGGTIRQGDTLVAVDGRLITTREGGRYLANLPVGRYVPIVLRRDGVLIRRTVTTFRGCGVRSLTVTPTDVGGAAAD